MALKAEVLAELKAAIKEAGATVEDLFDKEDITSTETAKKFKQQEYEHAKRVEKSLGEEREKVITLTKEKDEAQVKIKTLSEQVSRAQVGTLFTKSNETRKFNDKQKAFIERRLPGFKSEKSGDELQLEFDKYLDNEIKEFGEYAKVMGIKVEDPEVTPPGSGAPNDDGKDGDGKDLTDPKNNDMIPQG